MKKSDEYHGNECPNAGYEQDHFSSQCEEIARKDIHEGTSERDHCDAGQEISIDEISLAEQNFDDEMGDEGEEYEAAAANKPDENKGFCQNPEVFLAGVF